MDLKWHSHNFARTHSLAQTQYCFTKYNFSIKYDASFLSHHLASFPQEDVCYETIFVSQICHLCCQEFSLPCVHMVTWTHHTNLICCIKYFIVFPLCQRQRHILCGRHNLQVIPTYQIPWYIWYTFTLIPKGFEWQLSGIRHLVLKEYSLPCTTVVLTRDLLDDKYVPVPVFCMANPNIVLTKICCKRQGIQFFIIFSVYFPLN